MLNLLIKVLKGCLIGVAVIIPGVSAGSMAVSMGIYDHIVQLATAKKQYLRHTLKILLPYIIGILLGIAGFAYFIEILFAKFPFPTAMVFVGLIWGALPSLWRHVRGVKISKTNVLVLLSTMALMVALPILSSQSTGTTPLALSVGGLLLSFVLGFITSSVMMVPGMSGAMALMMLGYFETVLQHMNAFTTGLLRLDMTAVLQNGAILLPFALGAILGIIMVARAIKKLLSRYPVSTYYAIIGLVIASPFAVLHHQNLAAIALGDVLIGAACLAAGFGIALLLSGKE